MKQYSTIGRAVARLPGAAVAVWAGSAAGMVAGMALLLFTIGDLLGPEWRRMAGDKVNDRSWRCALPNADGGEAPMLFAALTDTRGAIVSGEPGPGRAGKSAAQNAAMAAWPGVSLKR